MGAWKGRRGVRRGEALTYLDLLHVEVQEGGALTDFNGRLGTDAAHGGTETAIEFEDAELVGKFFCAFCGRNFRPRHDEIGRRGRNERPVDGLVFGGQIRLEQALKAGHFTSEMGRLGGVSARRQQGRHLLVHVVFSRLSGEIEVFDRDRAKRRSHGGERERGEGEKPNEKPNEAIKRNECTPPPHNGN